MTEKVSLSEARRRLPELLEAVRTAHQHYLIVEDGEEQAALIGADEFRHFQARQEEQHAIETELSEADAWESEHPEEVEQWWYQLGQASLLTSLSSPSPPDQLPDLSRPI